MVKSEYVHKLHLISQYLENVLKDKREVKYHNKIRQYLVTLKQEIVTEMLHRGWYE